jgi:muramidase (phage lysozyme)
MRKRVMLFIAPLLVVAVAAGVAVASPSDAEHARGPKLDKLHAERPTAAPEVALEADGQTAGFEQSAQDIQNWVHYRQLQAYLDQLNLQKYLAAVAAAEAAASQRVYVPETSSVAYSSNPGGFLACVRQRESGGNYGVYNEGGSGAAGAYQFLPGTWNSIAASSGRGDLVGVSPAQAAPADQDAMAQALYAQQGAAPWGGGC